MGNVTRGYASTKRQSHAVCDGYVSQPAFNLCSVGRPGLCVRVCVGRQMRMRLKLSLRTCYQRERELERVQDGSQIQYTTERRINAFI